MTVLIGTVTQDARKYFPQFFGRLLGISENTTNVATPKWNPTIRLFKVGEGGFNGAVPRTPDATLRSLDAPFLQDLDCIIDPTRDLVDQRYATDERATFTKNLVDADFDTYSTNGIEISCLLETTDFNDDGFGNPPEIWELGIFCDHPVEAGEYLMIIYCTFDKQTKLSGQQILNKVRLLF